MRPEIYAGLEQGQVVTVRVTPRLGYVTRSSRHSREATRLCHPPRARGVRGELERSFALHIHD